MHIHLGWFDKRTIGMEKTTIRESIRNYCIVLKKLSASPHEFMERDRFIETTNGKTSSKVTTATTDSDKLTMLIGVFEAVDDSQDVEMGVDPMSIRLQTYDECPSLRIQSFGCGFEVFPQLGVIDQGLSVSVLSEDVLKQDWETRFSSTLFGNTSDNDPIKCATQIMYAIT